jgi:hypothetical protein
MSLDRIRGVEPGTTTAPSRLATLSGTGPRLQVSGLDLRSLDTAAVLRVLIEEVRSAAVDQLGFVPAADREAFPVADRDRAATVLLRIMTTLAGDPRFQPSANEDPARLLQDVLRLGADRALEVLARLPLASGSPRALIDATREMVSRALVDPVRQRTALVRSVQQALVFEAQRELEGSSRSGVLAPTAGVPHYEAIAPAVRPTLEALFAAILVRSAGAAPAASAQQQPAAIWARIEAPVRAEFGAVPEVDRALTALRERVFAAIAPGLLQTLPPSAEDSGQRFLDRIATALATAVSRPFSMPATATDARGIVIGVIDALRQIAEHAPADTRREAPLAGALEALRGLLASEASPATTPTAVRVPAAAAVVEARALLLRLLGSPEIADTARREPAAAARWLSEVAAALARDLGLPYRLDLAPPRRRLGLRRARMQASAPHVDGDPVAAIEQRDRADTTRRHD